MTTKVLDPIAAEKPKACPPEAIPLSRGTCLEFVRFCKEQHLTARAAHTFLRVLHNKSWEAECDQIREAMRPEVDRIFAPAESALADGANCKDVFDKLVKSLDNQK